MDRPGRPWAQGIGLLVLGLVVSGLANGAALSGDPGPALRAVGVAGYVLGLAVAGVGIHRILWVEPSGRPRWTRLVITAVVTVPAFIASGLALGVLLTILQLRFAS